MAHVGFPAWAARTRNVVCIGKNYDKHIKELAHLNPVWADRANAEPMPSLRPTEPMMFLKPTSALQFGSLDAMGRPIQIQRKNLINLPKKAGTTHYELEFCLIMGKTARNVDKSRWFEYVDGMTVGLDLTARDIQTEAKKAGAPWTLAKGFEGFAPIATGMIPMADIVAAANAAGANDVQAYCEKMEMKLDINGKTMQHTLAGEMLFAFDELVSYVSRVFTLEPGDVIYTGTPEGVGPLNAGDKCERSIWHSEKKDLGEVSIDYEVVIEGSL